MPLLDNKYEISQQRPLTARQTLFDATAPDGSAVRIIWFDLQTPAEEAAFEDYRRLLRVLQHEGLAAVYDLVSRPGATYVAWQRSAEARPKSDVQQTHLAEILRRYGQDLDDADVRVNGSEEAKLYGLAFDGALPPKLEPSEDMPAPTSKATRWQPPGLTQQLKRLPDWLLSWLPGLGLALLGLLLLTAGFALRTNNRVITIPDVLGQAVNETATQLYHLGLNVTTEAVPSEAPAGSVIGLVPTVGTELRPGRSVVVRYALPAGQLAPTVVPDLRGRSLAKGEVLTEDELEQQGATEADTEDDASSVVKALREQGLELGRVSHIYSSVAEGIVIAQSPPPGSETAEGSTVDILVSEGSRSEMTFLPDLTGLPQEVALELARDAGLSGSVAETIISGSSAPPGTVIDQNIAPYLLIPQDTATLRLSIAGGSDPASGDDSTIAPSLIGLSEQQAKRVAAEAGFGVTRVDYLASLNLPEGVMMQAPPPDSAMTGNNLRLTINVHPVPIPKPQVSVDILRSEPRLAHYAWFIEGNIPEQLAEVTAETLSGQIVMVKRERVKGGELIEGSWFTTEPGPITFRLTLNGIPYSEVLRVNP